MLRWWHRRRALRKNRCHFETEWCGHFIGRMHCTTHDFKTESLTEVQAHIRQKVLEALESAS